MIGKVGGEGSIDPRRVMDLRWLGMNAGKADGNRGRMERVEEAKGQTIKQLRSHGKRGSYILLLFEDPAKTGKQGFRNGLIDVPILSPLSLCLWIITDMIYHGYYGYYDIINPAVSATTISVCGMGRDIFLAWSPTIFIDVIQPEKRGPARLWPVLGRASSSRYLLG